MCIVRHLSCATAPCTPGASGLLSSFQLSCTQLYVQVLLSIPRLIILLALPLMLAASVTFSPVGALARIRSNSAGRHGFHFKQAAQDSKLSAKARVKSVMLRPEAMGITQTCRPMNVSKVFMTPQAPLKGSMSMKKVSGHKGFNWPICATGPGSEGNGPGEPGEESSEETCAHHDHDEMGNAPDLIKEKLSLDRFMKLKLKIRKQYIEDRLSDGDASAEARDLVELENEIKEMKVILELEELYRKAKAEALPPDVLDYIFLSFYLQVVFGSFIAFITGHLTDPLAHQLRLLLPKIKELYGNAILKEYSKFNP